MKKEETNKRENNNQQDNDKNTTTKIPMEVDNSTTTTTNNASKASSIPSPPNNRPASPTSAAVLAYLKKRGLGTAILELTKKLKEETELNNDNDNRKRKKDTIIDIKDDDEEDNEQEDNDDDGSKKIIEDIEIDNDRAKDARTSLTLSTGGGIGYDLDGAPNVITFGQFGNEKDSQNNNTKVNWEDKRGRMEGKQYIECFTTFLTYVLSLPSSSAQSNIVLPKVDDIMKRIDNNNNNTDKSSEDTLFWKQLSCNVITNLQSIQILSSSSSSSSSQNKDNACNTTCKYELFNITFPLYVHIYCELLELGLEYDAISFLNAFVSIYIPLYTKEINDLMNCNTTAKIVELNTAILQNSEGQSEIRMLTNKVDKLNQQNNNNNNNNGSDNITTTTPTPPVNINNLKEIENYKKKITQHKTMMDKNYTLVLSKYPFLKRARSLKWEIRLCTSSMDILTNFFNYNHIDLLCLNTLLQCRCHVMVVTNTNDNNNYESNSSTTTFIPSCCITFNDDDNNEVQSNKKHKVNWAAPIHPNNRAAIMDGKDASSMGSYRFTNLPYPKFYYSYKRNMKKDKIDDSKQQEELNDDGNDNDEDIVQFNRALLIHGFRRLEALEIKREYEDGMRNINKTVHNKSNSSCVSNPYKPSIFMSTLCSSRSSVNNTTSLISSSSDQIVNNNSTNNSILPSSNYNDFIPSDFHITCAKLSPNDGRRIAVGCEDSGIRIMSVDNGINNNSNKDDGIIEPLCILLGHKEGYPIFDVSWCRDGRTILSAGGDGTIRLWDTLAIGPYAKNTVKFTKDGGTKYKPPTNIPSSPPPITTPLPPTTSLPLPESTSGTNLVDINAAQLAVYRSHVSNTPVYSVTMAPSGYYFLSTGSDGISRIWLTDYPLKPFRLLLSGSGSGRPNPVHCGAWHPNCNYVFTGSNDGIIRMFDVHSGRCVRILSGLSSSIDTLTVCPSGRYIVASSGMNIGMWDIASGRLIQTYDTTTTSSSSSYGNTTNNNSNDGEIYTMSYSACGTTLATGGTDSCVHLWDVRSSSASATTSDYHTIYRTKQTMLLDLQYTKRNLLMAVGKYVA